jgi:hypothetical protein
MTKAPALLDVFALRGGSVVGREHRRLLRNNQDGLALAAAEGVLVAAVTDWCSSGRSSEVGARLAAAWIERFAPELASCGDPATVAEAVTTALSNYLLGLARALSPAPDPLDPRVGDLLLFSFLAAVVREDAAFVFGVGDGVWSVNGRITTLDAGPANTPHYLAYGLLGGEPPRPALHFAGDPASVASIAIATDGALDLPDLPAFERDPRYVRNPSLVQKRLVALGDRAGGLFDDTTVALVLRRVAAS